MSVLTHVPLALMLLLAMLSLLFFPLWLDSLHRQNCAPLMAFTNDDEHKENEENVAFWCCEIYLLHSIIIEAHSRLMLYTAIKHTLFTQTSRENGRAGEREREREKSNRFELRLSHCYDFRPVGRISWKYPTVRAPLLRLMLLLLWLCWCCCSLAVDGYNNNKQ